MFKQLFKKLKQKMKPPIAMDSPQLFQLYHTTQSLIDSLITSTSLDEDECLDAYCTIQSLQGMLAERDGGDIKEKLSDLFKARDQFIQGTRLDYCYHQGLVNQALTELVRVIWHVELTEDTQLSVYDILMASSKSIIDSTGTEQRLFDFITYQEINLPHTAAHFVRDKAGLVHRLALLDEDGVTYVGLIARAVEQLRIAEKSQTPTWLVEDVRLGSYRTLQSEIVTFLVSRFPAFAALDTYMRQLQAQDKANEVKNKIRQLKDGLIAGGKKGGTGKEEVAGEEASLAVAEFSEWLNELRATNDDHYLTLMQMSDGRTTFQQIIYPLISPREASETQKFVDCVDSIGMKLEQFLEDAEIAQTLNGFSAEIQKMTKLSDRHLAELQTTAWQQVMVKDDSDLSARVSTIPLAEAFTSSVGLATLLDKLNTLGVAYTYQDIAKVTTFFAKQPGLSELNNTLWQVHPRSGGYARATLTELMHQYPWLVALRFFQGADMKESNLQQLPFHSLKVFIAASLESGKTIEQHWLLRSLQLAVRETHDQRAWFLYLLDNGLSPNATIQFEDCRYPEVCIGKRVEYQHKLISYKVVARDENTVMLRAPNSFVRETNGYREDVIIEEVWSEHDKDDFPVDLKQRANDIGLLETEGQSVASPLVKVLRHGTLMEYALSTFDVKLISKLFEKGISNIDLRNLYDETGQIISHRMLTEFVNVLYEYRQSVYLMPEQLQKLFNEIIRLEKFNLLEKLIPLGIMPDRHQLTYKHNYAIEEIRYGAETIKTLPVGTVAEIKSNGRFRTAQITAVATRGTHSQTVYTFSTIDAFDKETFEIADPTQIHLPCTDGGLYLPGQSFKIKRSITDYAFEKNNQNLLRACLDASGKLSKPALLLCPGASLTAITMYLNAISKVATFYRLDLRLVELLFLRSLQALEANTEFLAEKQGLVLGHLKVMAACLNIGYFYPPSTSWERLFNTLILMNGKAELSSEIGDALYGLFAISLVRVPRQEGERASYLMRLGNQHKLRLLEGITSALPAIDQQYANQHYATFLRLAESACDMEAFHIAERMISFQVIQPYQTLNHLAETKAETLLAGFISHLFQLDKVSNPQLQQCLLAAHKAQNKNLLAKIFRYAPEACHFKCGPSGKPLLEIALEEEQHTISLFYLSAGVRLSEATIKHYVSSGSRETNRWLTFYLRALSEANLSLQISPALYLELFDLALVEAANNPLAYATVDILFRYLYAISEPLTDSQKQRLLKKAILANHTDLINHRFFKEYVVEDWQDSKMSPQSWAGLQCYLNRIKTMPQGVTSKQLEQLASLAIAHEQYTLLLQLFDCGLRETYTPSVRKENISVLAIAIRHNVPKLVEVAFERRYGELQERDGNRATSLMAAAEHEQALLVSQTTTWPTIMAYCQAALVKDITLSQEVKQQLLGRAVSEGQYKGVQRIVALGADPSELLKTLSSGQYRLLPALIASDKQALVCARFKTLYDALYQTTAVLNMCPFRFFRPKQQWQDNSLTLRALIAYAERKPHSRSAQLLVLMLTQPAILFEENLSAEQQLSLFKSLHQLSISSWGSRTHLSHEPQDFARLEAYAHSHTSSRTATLVSAIQALDTASMRLDPLPMVAMA